MLMKELWKRHFSYLASGNLNCCNYYREHFDTIKSMIDPAIPHSRSYALGIPLPSQNCDICVIFIKAVVFFKEILFILNLFYLIIWIMLTASQTKIKANMVYKCIFERNATFYISCLDNANSKTSYTLSKMWVFFKVCYTVFPTMKKTQK